MKQLLTILALALSLPAFSQERIFSLGYAKNYVNQDSSNFSLQIDFNRIPGKTENPGTFYLLNTALGGSQWGVYIKPTADVNLGSYTTIAPNNITIGLPIGLAYDLPHQANKGLVSASLELSPELVSDKSLQQYLYFLNKAVVVTYSYVPNPSSMILDVSTGLYVANGKRMVDVKTKTKNDYGRVSVPLYVSGSFFRNTAANFFRLKLTGVYKYYNVYKDDATITPDETLSFGSVKLEYFFIKNLGISIAYMKGHDEPLFKKINSLSFGITVAR